MERRVAEEKLFQIFGFHQFYDIQWDAVRKVLNHGKVLLIQKTGFGKSLCYQFPALLFEGLVLIFSPLIALMREQTRRLNDVGIPTACLHSGNTPEENEAILKDATEGKYKILYITPERLSNEIWNQYVADINISMVVMDEAHCISTWGHDFRPDYQRIVRLIKILPDNIPFLATTATATRLVEEDIQRQVGKELIVIRGNLIRPNLTLTRIEVTSDSEKMSWIKNTINRFEGTGIIYVGTRFEAELYYRWLEFNGIPCRSYHSSISSEDKQEIEDLFHRNEIKAVIATSALGMGIDKADVRFIIHTQIPQSPIHYYQEIGRAGRDGKTAFIVLLYKSGDDELPLSFIEHAKPEERQYQKVISALETQPLTFSELCVETNLKYHVVKNILRDLSAHEIITRKEYQKKKHFELLPGDHSIDFETHRMIKQHKMKELHLMLDYIHHPGCLMTYLCRYLGDEVNQDCGHCDHCKGRTHSVELSKEDVQLLNRFYDRDFVDVEMFKGPFERIIATSAYGHTKVGKMLHRYKYENPSEYPEYLIERFINAFRDRFGEQIFDVILYVPSTISGDIMKNFAEKVSLKLNLPISHQIVKIRTGAPQKGMRNVYAKRQNIAGAYQCLEPETLIDKNVLLIDDIWDTGTTMKEIGRLLKTIPVKSVSALVIAKKNGGED